MALHHPDKALYPDWELFLPNQLFHQVVTIIQHMNATDLNLSYIRAFIDSLEYEYLMKRRILDEEEK